MAITDHQESSVYRTGADGLQHRSVWVGDVALFCDADGDGKVSDWRENLFTDWAT